MLGIEEELAKLNKRLAEAERNKTYHLRWNPVNERLPKEYGEDLFRKSDDVLVTARNNCNHLFVSCAYMSKGEWIVDCYEESDGNVEVVAWMELPEVYDAE